MACSMAIRRFKDNSMSFSTILVLFLVAEQIRGFDIFEEDKRQDLVPFPRIGRSYLAWNEDKRQGLLPFPRIGRAVYDIKRQGLIPFPRIGRAIPFYDMDLEDIDEMADPIALSPYKRAALAFTPRIGRKKRSASNNEESHQSDSSDITRVIPASWNFAGWDESDPDEIAYYYRNSRQLIPSPRMGRGSLIPRLGRKRSDPDSDSPKRAAFTPRIGRAPLIPRIGRSGQDSSSLAFTSRLGRAAFIPRIGRSDNRQDTVDDNKN